MRDFYERVLGLTVTDEDPGQGMVFVSSRPEQEHHEMVLAQGRTAPREAKLINAGRRAHARPGADPELARVSWWGCQAWSWMVTA